MALDTTTINIIFFSSLVAFCLIMYATVHISHNTGWYAPRGRTTTPNRWSQGVSVSLSFPSRRARRLYQRDQRDQQQQQQNQRQFEDIEAARQRAMALGAQLVNKIPIVRFQAQEESTQCAVCVNDLVDGEAVRKLQCGHVFHPYCIDSYLGEYAARCPVWYVGLSVCP